MKTTAGTCLKDLMTLLLAIILAGCGSPWEKLDGTWLCDVEATLAREQGIKNIPRQKAIGTQDLQLRSALSNLFIIVDAKKKTITSNIANPYYSALNYEFEPSTRGNNIVLTTKSALTLHFSVQDDKTALIWFTGGAAMIFRLSPRGISLRRPLAPPP